MNTAFRFIFTHVENERYDEFRRDLEKLSKALPNPGDLLVYTTVEEKERLEPHGQKTIYAEVPMEFKGRFGALLKKYGGIETNPRFPGDTLPIK